MKLGHKHSWLARQKIKAARAKQVISPEHLAALSKSKKGRAVTPETRAKISAALKGRCSARKLAALKLRHASPEWRAKISAANKGHSVSPETRAKISAARARQRFPFNHTAPERAVHAWLMFHDMEFQTHHRIGVHAFDVAIPSVKTLIEVDGCFWHRCPIHAPSSPYCPDIQEAERQAREAGWTVAHVWQHDIGLLRTWAVRGSAVDWMLPAAM